MFFFSPTLAPLFLGPYYNSLLLFISWMACLQTESRFLSGVRRSEKGWGAKACLLVRWTALTDTKLNYSRIFVVQRHFPWHGESFIYHKSHSVVLLTWETASVLWQMMWVIRRNSDLLCWHQIIYPFTTFCLSYFSYRRLLYTYWKFTCEKESEKQKSDLNVVLGFRAIYQHPRFLSFGKGKGEEKKKERETTHYDLKFRLNERKIWPNLPSGFWKNFGISPCHGKGS